jgi:serine/threonine protein kinase
MTTGDDAHRTFGDRYVLAERLTAADGREVWRAHDDIVGRQVALKIFFGAQPADPTWREAFRRDAERLTALSHPGIAKVYEHAESDQETWLAMAFVAGEPLSTRIDSGTPLAAAEALDIIGQSALALQAAHDAGVAHGDLTTASLLIRDDGVVALIGFALASGATQADDLRALSALAHDCLRGALRSTPDLPASVYDFVGWLTNADRAAPPTDAADIGRTALALAASLNGRHRTKLVPNADPHSPMYDTANAAPRYDIADRKRVRNRLITLGAIVVIFGGALMFLVGRGGGDVTVPYVIGLPLGQAQLSITSTGLRDTQVVAASGADSGGTVVSESPSAGERVKAGSLVTLTISNGSTG